MEKTDTDCKRRTRKTCAKFAQDTQTEVNFVERNNALHLITDKRLKPLGHDAFNNVELNQ